MIIKIKPNASKEAIQEVTAFIKRHGLSIDASVGREVTLLGIIGDTRQLPKQQLELLPAVEKLIPILKDYKLASREFHPENTVVKVNGLKIGGEQLVVMAGPCAIEGEEQLLEVARAVKDAGAHILRASAFKPRTSPYDFQGLGEEGLKMLRKAKQATGLVTETEVLDVRDVELVAKYVDIVRVGARNMQNFDLLKEVGKIDKPVILKNGISSTLKEFLLAAEYIMAEGNRNVILCSRGIRTFETMTRFTLDVNTIPLLHKESHLPVIVDPSHASGIRELVQPMSRAAVAAGADGLLVEVHSHPEHALCDGKQALLPEDFGNLMADLRKLAPIVGRTI